jgi:hypothetical protein
MIVAPTLIEGTLDEYVLSLANRKETTFPGGEGHGESTPEVPTPRRARRSRQVLMPWQTPLPEADEGEYPADHAFRVFFSLLIRHGLRVQGQAGGTLTMEQIEEALEEYADTAITECNLPTTNSYEVATGRESKRGGYSERSIARSVRRAAQYVVQDFDLAKYRMIQDQASRSGAKTKWTLEHFLETAHMTPTQAARHLGLTRPTVYAMRKRYSNIDLTTGEIRD